MKKRTLKELRAKYDLTQSELAKKLAVTPVTISHWENGTFQMNQIAKMAVAYVLGIDWRMIEDVKKNKK